MNDVSRKSGRRLGFFAPFIGVLQARIREAIVPLDRVAPLIPLGAKVLEVGCGEGLVLKRILDRAVEITGVDIDSRKINRANQLLGSKQGVDLRVADAFEYLSQVEDRRFTVTLLVDTLSAVEPENQERLLKELYRVTASGGCLILKVVDGGVRFKSSLSRLVSGLVCGVLHMSLSADQKFTYRTSAELQATLERLGAEVEVRHLHREQFHPIPHILITCRKPGVPGR